ncbi:hypothetical protein DYH09_09890 [bacterium CPR1]|nr:hypothetical protein [bacterium CPR1]
MTTSTWHDERAMQVSPTPPRREWTILFYLDGNNRDIERDVYTSFLTAEESAGHPACAMAAELGRLPSPNPFPRDPYQPKIPNDADELWETTRRYEMLPGDPPGPYARRVYTSQGQHDGQIDSRLVADLGQRDMSCPENLTEFLKWGMKTYPAEHVMVVLTNHGAGFLGTLSDQRAGRHMPLAEVKAALEEASRETGVKPDVLVMDACLMAQAEALAELKDAAGCYVASQDVIYSCYPWQKTLNRAREDWEAGRQVAPEQMVSYLVGACAEQKSDFPAVSAVRSDRVDPLLDSLRELADSLLATTLPEAEVRRLMAASRGFSSPQVRPFGDYRDLSDFAGKLQGVADERVAGAARGVAAALKEAVVAEAHQGERPASGLTVYLPPAGFRERESGFQYPDHTRPEQYESIYRGLEFARRTGWDRVIERFGE